MEDAAPTPPPETASAGPARPPSPWPRVVLILGLVFVLASAVVVGIALWPRSSQPTAMPPPAPSVTPTSTPSTSPVPQDTPQETPTSAPADDLTPQELAQTYSHAIWKVEVEGCGSMGTGTAFTVGSHTLITNAHVIDFDATPQLTSRDGQRQIAATVAGADAALDVAVLITDQELPGEPLTWAGARALAEGQQLVALGYPVPDHSFTVTPATVLNFETVGDVRQALRLDGLIDKGNSGGPALTSSGEVAGIITYVLQGGLQQIPVAHTYDYVADAIAAIERERPGWHPNCDEPPPAPVAPDEWDWESDDEPEEPDVSDPYSYGDDPYLDELYDACAGGDMLACDDLYLTSPYDSEYEEFGTTCGGTRAEPVFGYCSWIEDESEAFAEPHSYGDDPYLDELYDACADGNMLACDDLYYESPPGSEYDEFASTCGGTGDGFGWCDWEYGEEQKYGAALTYGDDPYLDELWDECAAGDLWSCDFLYFDSDHGTDYEEFGSTCGHRRDPTDGACAE